MTRKSWADLKRMWITYDEGGAPLDVFYKEHPGAVGWVRADLVDGLVKHVEEMTELNRVYWKAIGFNPSEGGAFQEVLDKARAALKALEEGQ